MAFFFLNPTQTITFSVALQNIVLMEVFFLPNKQTFQLCFKRPQRVKTHGDASRAEACFRLFSAQASPGAPDSQGRGDVLTNHATQASFPLRYQV